MLARSRMRSKPRPCQTFAGCDRWSKRSRSCGRVLDERSWSANRCAAEHLHRGRRHCRPGSAVMLRVKRDTCCPTSSRRLRPHLQKLEPRTSALPPRPFLFHAAERKGRGLGATVADCRLFGFTGNCRLEPRRHRPRGVHCLRPPAMCYVLRSRCTRSGFERRRFVTHDRHTARQSTRR